MSTKKPLIRLKVKRRSSSPPLDSSSLDSSPSSSPFRRTKDEVKEIENKIEKNLDIPPSSSPPLPIQTHQEEEEEEAANGASDGDRNTATTQSNFSLFQNFQEDIQNFEQQEEEKKEERIAAHNQPKSSYTMAADPSFSTPPPSSSTPVAVVSSSRFFSQQQQQQQKQVQPSSSSHFSASVSTMILERLVAVQNEIIQTQDSTIQLLLVMQSTTNQNRRGRRGEEDEEEQEEDLRFNVAKLQSKLIDLLETRRKIQDEIENKHSSSSSSSSSISNSSPHTLPSFSRSAPPVNQKKSPQTQLQQQQSQISNKDSFRSSSPIDVDEIIDNDAEEEEGRQTDFRTFTLKSNNRATFSDEPEQQHTFDDDFGPIDDAQAILEDQQFLKSQANPYYEDDDYEQEPEQRTPSKQSFSFSSSKKSQPATPSSSASASSSSFSGNNNTNSTTNKDWSKENFPWSSELRELLKDIFGLNEFRPNQLEIMNATLSGRDVFVLMPTGAGKSLCYQLPALISKGITIVISPLISLIQDQVLSLNQNDIDARYLSGENASGREAIYRAMNPPLHSSNNNNASILKILYITPEMIAQNARLGRELTELYDRGNLARIVIDEAHCVSQWGHDFRPHYKRLDVLRQKFPNTPILALTATATARVKADVIQNLKMRSNYLEFKLSFNRPNLFYEIVDKNKKSIEDLVEFVSKNHRDDCGIVYCLSTHECDKVYEALRSSSSSLRVGLYHAKRTDVQRSSVLENWLNSKINIVVATIAFGMGINKPNVRFVIHFSFPSSIEGYYQETGRAGRDGEKSICRLYYNFSDKHRHQLLISSSAASGNFQSKNGNLVRMAKFCENQVDCRRKMQLEYFGEDYNPLANKHKRSCCDNCRDCAAFESEDITEYAKQLVQIADNLSGKGSPNTIVDIWRGSKAKATEPYRDNIEEYGKGASVDKTKASRILKHLILECVLDETVNESSYGSLFTYLTPNQSMAHRLMEGLLTIKMKVRAKTSSKSKSKSKIALESPSSNSNKGSKDEENSSSKNSSNSSKLSKRHEDIKAILIQLRADIAKSKKIGQPISIFSETTLNEMCSVLPKTIEEFLSITGVGKIKASSYGIEFLGAIRKFRSECKKDCKPDLTAEEMERIKGLDRSKKHIHEIIEVKEESDNKKKNTFQVDNNDDDDEEMDYFDINKSPKEEDRKFIDKRDFLDFDDEDEEDIFGEEEPKLKNLKRKGKGKQSATFISDEDEDEEEKKGSKKKSRK